MYVCFLFFYKYIYICLFKFIYICLCSAEQWNIFESFRFRVQRSEASTERRLQVWWHAVWSWARPIRLGDLDRMLLVDFPWMLCYFWCCFLGKSTRYWTSMENNCSPLLSWPTNGKAKKSWWDNDGMKLGVFLKPGFMKLAICGMTQNNAHMIDYWEWWNLLDRRFAVTSMLRKTRIHWGDQRWHGLRSSLWLSLKPLVAPVLQVIPLLERPQSIQETWRDSATVFFPCRVLNIRYLVLNLLALVLGG